jgi:hypothetical protein
MRRAPQLGLKATPLAAKGDQMLGMTGIAAHPQKTVL